MNTKAFLAAEVNEVLRLMDDSADTSAAIRKVLLAVYTSGVTRGVKEGYDVGYKDGKRGKPKARDEDTARRVVDGIGSDARSDGVRGKAAS